MASTSRSEFFCFFRPSIIRTSIRTAAAPLRNRFINTSSYVYSRVRDKHRGRHDTQDIGLVFVQFDSGCYPNYNQCYE